MTSTLVISLDFEMFWGVSDRQSVRRYGDNVLGEWQAIPALLALFRRHHVRVTWATVGMIMCRGVDHWRALRPALLPSYSRPGISPYDMETLVREYPRLFFARPMVEQILAGDGQELATHTYSHFYSHEAGATPAQFAADLAYAGLIAGELGVRFRSLVFPRNQVCENFLDVLPAAGIHVYRGNAEHWLYRNGDAVAGGAMGRLARFADACLPLSGHRTVHPLHERQLVNLPASLFLYPWSAAAGVALALRLRRVKEGMTAAARAGGVFHLWWHPHNFGLHMVRNLAMLDELLRHYHVLAERYGMQTRCMGDFAPTPAPATPLQPAGAAPGAASGAAAR